MVKTQRNTNPGADNPYHPIPCELKTITTQLLGVNSPVAGELKTSLEECSLVA